MCLALAGCVNARQITDASARLTKNEVLLIAKAKAIQEGFDLDDFNITGCRYYVEDDETWTVFFEMKPPIVVGGHFLVWVNDLTREAVLMHGQ